jgi:hypothetical protein
VDARRTSGAGTRCISARPVATTTEIGRAVEALERADALLGDRRIGGEAVVGTVVVGGERLDTFGIEEEPEPWTSRSARSSPSVTTSHRPVAATRANTNARASPARPAQA